MLSYTLNVDVAARGAREREKLTKAETLKRRRGIKVYYIDSPVLEVPSCAKNEVFH